MSNDPLKIATSAICECLTQCPSTSEYTDVIENPYEFTEGKWGAISICISALIYRKLTSIVPNTVLCGDVNSILNALSDISGEWTALPKSIPMVLKDSVAILDKAVRQLISVDPSQYELVDIYESLISIEFDIVGGAVIASDSKSSRNRIGGYYTPTQLAEICVSRTVQHHLNQRVPDLVTQTNFTAKKIQDLLHILSQLCVADLSCGGGRFLSAYFRYICDFIYNKLGDKNSSIDIEQLMREIVLNIVGYDIDPLALDVAKTELTVEVRDLSLLTQISKNFHQANPLLIAYPEVPSKDKIQLFQHGLIYHKSLGISLDAIDDKIDLVIGNPPWEKIRLEEKSFFKHLAPKVAVSPNKRVRAGKINSLKENSPLLYKYYNEMQDAYETARNNIKKDPRFRYSAIGELNTYALFTELAFNCINKRKGVIGLLVKSSLVTTSVNQQFFKYMLENKKLVEISDFDNRNKIFPVDGRERFIFLLAGRGEKDGGFNLRMGLTKPDDLNDESRFMYINESILKRLNPLTGVIPNISQQKTLSFLIKIVKNNERFDDVYPDAQFGRIVHLTMHAGHINNTPSPESLPIYEGKFIEQYDGWFSDFAEVSESERYVNKAKAKRIPIECKHDPTFKPTARYYINQEVWKRLSARYQENWSLMWRSTTSATNRRTCIATILPHLPAIQSIQFLQIKNGILTDLGILLALMNSLVFDFIVRQKLTGIDMTQKVIRQIPVPPKVIWGQVVQFACLRATLREHILERVCGLLGDDPRLSMLCSELISHKPVISHDRRKTMREIDVLVGYAYGLQPGEFNVLIKFFNKYLTNEEVKWLADVENWPIPELMSSSIAK